MAKLNGPLFSFGARGKLGGALVFAPWKGLNNVRRYVVPANPNTTLQSAQRTKLTAAVAAIHAAMQHAEPLAVLDKAAYGVWASVVQASSTWFNQAVRNHVNVAVAGKTPTVFHGGAVTPGANQLVLKVYSPQIDGADITAATCFYGLSPTSMLESVAAALVAVDDEATCTIAGLDTGVKYYMQLRVDLGENCEGAMSGIYTGIPT